MKQFASLRQSNPTKLEWLPILRGRALPAANRGPLARGPAMINDQSGSIQMTATSLEP